MPNEIELEELRTQIVALADRVQSLQDELAHDRSGPEAAPVDIEVDTAVTRRNWMKAAAAAAVGGTAVALSQSQPVAAASNMQIGTYNADDVRTVGDHTGAAGADISFLFKTRMSATGESAEFPAALAGWSGTDVRPHGVHGLSAKTTGEGIGVIGESKSNRGTGVRGKGWYGVIGTGTDYGVAGTGSKGSLLVNTSGFVPPIAVPVEALPGAIYGESTDPFSNTGSVWCSVSDSGEWRKLAGFDTAGSLHPIEPRRAYDSRAPLPLQGALAAGGSRPVSVADGRDIVSGAVTFVGLVPDGATAITYNLTITNTVNGGFVAIAPGSATDYAASAINWSSSGTTVANAGVVKLGLDRQVMVFAEGGATDFIIDITGYYL